MLVRLSLLLAFLFILSLSVGAVSVSGTEILGIFSGNVSDQTMMVLGQLRLPRSIMAALTGAVLSVGGAVMQSLLRNPLAEPGLVGVSAGAAIGAVLLLFFGVSSFLWIGLAGFIGALFMTWFAWQLSRSWATMAGLLLAGIAINALVFSLISLLISLASDAQIRSITFWSLGSMTRTPWPVILFLLCWTPLGLWWIYKQWPALNALLLGDRAAMQVGVKLDQLRLSLITAMALLVGPMVAYTGAISFVGLLVPQVVRHWCGSDHRQLLPAAALLGASVVLVADILSRLLVSPGELPTGVVVSLIGAPAFLWVLRRQGN